MLDWLIGLSISVLANIVSSLGPNIQKLALQSQTNNGSNKKLWWFGQMLVIVGNIADLMALSFASVSIIAPLASLILPCNFIAANRFFNEPWNRYDLWSMGVIFIGMILAISFGDHRNTTYDIDAMYGFLDNAIFIVYFVMSILVALKLSRAIKTEPNKGSSNYMYCFKICALSGILSSYSILFGKMTMELIKESIQGSNQMNKFTSWYFVVLLGVCIFLQMYYYNKALKRFQMIFCVPVFQCFFINVSMLSTIIFFQEYVNFSPAQYVMMILSSLIMGLGTIGLYYNQLEKKKASSAFKTIILDDMTRDMVMLERYQPLQMQHYEPIPAHPLTINETNPYHVSDTVL